MLFYFYRYIYKKKCVKYHLTFYKFLSNTVTVFEFEFFLNPSCSLIITILKNYKDFKFSFLINSATLPLFGMAGKKKKYFTPVSEATIFFNFIFFYIILIFNICIKKYRYVSKISLIVLLQSTTLLETIFRT